MEIDKSILQGYEDAALYEYGSLPADCELVPFDELPDRFVHGVLKANFHKDGRLMQLYSRDENHVAVIAATRLGKTTSYIIPSIVSYALQKVKRSMIISDPKGEVYRKTADMLRGQGYDVKLLNFRDSRHSECWNPLTPIYRLYRRAQGLESEVSAVMEDNVAYHVFDGRRYESYKVLTDTLARTKRLLLNDVGNEIDKLSQIVLVTPEKDNDPYWIDSARELFKGFLWAMLEDSDKPAGENPITEDTYSFKTMIGVIDTFHDGDESTFNDDGYFSDRSENSRARSYAQNTILSNGRPTRKCIMSMLVTNLSCFSSTAMQLVTCCNTFGFDALVSDKPVAVYINYRDELKVHYKAISMFVQSAYTYLIDYANKQIDGKLPVPFMFLLDEFGNFPPITDMETTISACAGRNIWFVLVLQSYAQLISVYDPNIAEIIRDNLNVHVFFGSNNPDTLQEFSRECGEYTRLSPLSALNGGGTRPDTFVIETIRRMPVSRLTKLDPGECVVTEACSGYVLMSKMERYFTCAEFDDLTKTCESEYECPVDTSDVKYEYRYKRKRRRSSNPFDF